MELEDQWAIVLCVVHNAIGLIVMTRPGPEHNYRPVLDF